MDDLGPWLAVAYHQGSVYASSRHPSCRSVGRRPRPRPRPLDLRLPMIRSLRRQPVHPTPEHPRVGQPGLGRLRDLRKRHPNPLHPTRPVRLLHRIRERPIRTVPTDLILSDPQRIFQPPPVLLIGQLLTLRLSEHHRANTPQAPAGCCSCHSRAARIAAARPGTSMGSLRPRRSLPDHRTCHQIVTHADDHDGHQHPPRVSPARTSGKVQTTHLPATPRTSPTPPTTPFSQGDRGERVVPPAPVKGPGTARLRPAPSR